MQMFATAIVLAILLGIMIGVVSTVTAAIYLDEKDRKAKRPVYADLPD